MLKNTLENYGSVSKFFHWIIALLIIGMLFLGYFMVGQKILTLHQLIGLSILTLATCRLIWIISNTHPRLPSTVSRLDKLAARSVQVLLYVCMFGMPLSGWAMSTAFGFIPHIGTYYLPMPGISVDQSLGIFLENIHNTLAIILIALIGLHVAGALKHYFIDKDSVLQSMLPKSKNKQID
jgi:cytochrome b561